MTRPDYDALLDIATTAADITGGVWRRGKNATAVVCDKATGLCKDSGHDDIEYYGGYLVAESIWSPYITTFMSRLHPAQVLELLSMIDRESLPE